MVEALFKTFSFGKFFNIHDNKFKLYPIRDLNRTSVKYTESRVFCIGKDSFGGFLAFYNFQIVCKIEGFVSPSVL